MGTTEGSPCGMTMVEKILARHAGREVVRPGEMVLADLDFCLGNDVTAPPAIAEFERLGAKSVFDPERIALVSDHFVPNKDIKSAELNRQMRLFSQRQGLKHYYELGNGGVEHAILPEKGLVLPGDLIVGADSHTCTYGGLGALATGVGSTDLAVAMATGRAWFKVPPTIQVVFQGRRPPGIGGKDLILKAIGILGVDGANYQALEFTGEAVADLSIEGRLTMANMAIEAGAKAGLFAPDALTESYVAPRAVRSYQPEVPDPDAVYIRRVEIDVAGMEMQVAVPFLPENARDVSQLGEVQLDQVVIGSCTNGRIEDLRVAAAVLRGRRVHPGLRLLVLPASQEVYGQALREGIIEDLLTAGAVIGPPTCGPCLGGHMGILAAGERALATTNRNFVGRMGSPESEVYLSGPAVAAASAITGRITAPEGVGE